MHIHGTDLGMSEGLSPVLPHSDAYERTGHLCESDFREFGRLIGLNEKRIESVLFCSVIFAEVGDVKFAFEAGHE